MQSFRQKFIYNFGPNRKELRKMQILGFSPGIDPTLMSALNIDLQSPGNEYSSPPPEIGLFTTALPARSKVVPKISFQIFHLLGCPKY